MQLPVQVIVPLVFAAGNKRVNLLERVVISNPESPICHPAASGALLYIREDDFRVRHSERLPTSTSSCLLTVHLPPMLRHDSQQILRTGSASALADAQAFVCRRISADGSVDGEDGDFSLPERQWSALIKWAGTCGRILPVDFPGPEREGGREHDVTLDEGTGGWIKFTKPSACGYTVSWGTDGKPFLHNALPLEYLQRLLWQIEMLGDDIHLVGLWEALPLAHRHFPTRTPGFACHAGGVVRCLCGSWFRAPALAGYWL